ncbi:MAG TPA: malate synthase A, partial [Actinomycetes bacterium]|nr:malate synthase A [Actinomycetes bacterium]
MALPDGVEVRGPARETYPAILSDDALALVAELQRALGPTRSDLLARRAERQAALDAGELPDFLEATASVRSGDWRVAPVEGLADRRVEITGPTDRKMVINALNSGAQAFMADFEDATAPTWANLVEGQANLYD